MVAGDHAHLDPRAVTLGDGVLGLGARWVDDADHGQDRQVVHLVDQLALGIERLRVEVAACHHHHTLAHLRHPVVFLHRHALVLFDDRLHVAARQPERAAAGDQHVRRTLDKAADHLFALGILHLVEGGHELVVGVKRHLGHARVHLPCAFDADTALLRQHDQRTLGRVADQRFAVEPSVGAQRHRQQDLVEIDLGAAGVQQLALGAVAFARHLVAVLPGDRELTRRHLVERQRAGLVRADGRHRTQRLYRRQPLDDRILCRQLACARRVHRRHHCRQAGRDGGNRQRHTGNEDRIKGLAVAEARG